MSATVSAVFVHDGQAIPATITSTPELITITTDDFPLLIPENVEFYYEAMGDD